VAEARPRSLAFADVELDDFQRLIDATFGERDRARGVPSSVAWLAEEVGELAQAVRKGSHAQQVHEFADVLAWLTSLANQVGVNLDESAQRYADGCPRCSSIPCTCP
jgi:NTP pyrophosphatase (non-canonical NTP hydrolase)